MSLAGTSLSFSLFPAWMNSFWRGLPPMVSQSFLLASSSPPDIDGLASTAICANCQVGDNSGNLPTSPNFLHLHSSFSPSHSGLEVSSHIRCWMFYQCWGFWFNMYLSSMSLTLLGLSLIPFQGVMIFVLAILEVKESQPIRSQSSFVRVTWYLFWTGYHAFPKISIQFQLFFSVGFFPTMSKDWSKYMKILEREDREFKIAMQEEVSTLFSFEFNRKQQSFGWGWNYHPAWGRSFNFQAMFSSYVLTIIKFHFYLGIRSKHEWSWGGIASLQKISGT